MRSTPEERTVDDGVRKQDYDKLLAEWTNVEELLCQRNHNPERDRDSAEDSTCSSKEDVFNDDPENDGTTCAENGVCTPEKELCNGELEENGLYDNKTSMKASPNSELDNESGCYDCGDDVSKQLTSSLKRCTVCGLEICGASTESREGWMNGCHGDEKNGYEDRGGERTYCTCKNGDVLHRLCSYSVCLTC